ncbi:MAG: DUF58 domain-containing protein [Chitinophagaceae bacterium]
MWKTIRRKLRYYAQFLPFTINTLLFALIILLVRKFLYTPPVDPKKTDDIIGYNNSQPFILLMAKIALWMVVAFVCLSVLSTLIAWLYYLWLKKKKTAGLQLEFSLESNTGKNNRVFLNAVLEGAFRPILGFVKGRLYYDDYQITDKFPLLSNQHKKGSFWRTAIRGKSRLRLPDIKEYQIRGGFVFFEDMLRLFSLAVPEDARGHFHQAPVFTKRNEQEVAPRKTETTDIRIDQMRRVEGEHLSYKDFESGDDVRRIVWKVYAKNRELVVRIPERFEPYASHLYFYASFYADFSKAGINGDFGKEMLNYFKNNVWTVYDTLAAKEFEMRYIPDQTVPIAEEGEGGARVAKIISASTWHKDKTLDSYFDIKQGTVLCISSFTDPRELEQILDGGDQGTVIYFIKLSNTFRHMVVLNWLKRLLFLPPKDRLNRLRNKWVFSPIRLQIKKREKEISILLQKGNSLVQEL